MQELSLTNPDRTNGLGANKAATGSRRGEDGINTPTSPSAWLLFVTNDRVGLVMVFLDYERLHNFLFFIDLIIATPPSNKRVR